MISAVAMEYTNVAINIIIFGTKIINCNIMNTGDVQSIIESKSAGKMLIASLTAR